MFSKKFIIRSGSRLILDGKPFKFAGPNIYWLGLDENVGGIDWPTEFRVLNALDTAIEMGATVVRSHTLGASCGHPKSIQPELGVFNEEALRKVDFAIHAAGQRDLRLVIPFVCNFDYYHGGRVTFTRWQGLENRDEFYTNREVIEDFKKYIAVLLNRVNTCNGIVYKDDPTIMAWELGNELNQAPVAWAQEITDFIKSQDSNHLVAHGKQFQLDEDKLSIDNLDIIDVHYYPAEASEMVRDALRVQSAGKIYISGEFGWPTGDLTEFLHRAETEESISGTLYWSLFGHHDKCGYVQHFDGFSVHYPGNAANEETQARISQLREHAFRMNNKEVPPRRAPDRPFIEEACGSIVFQGVVGAAYYTIEKSTNSAEGPWTVIYDRRASDHHMPWIDPTRAQTIRTWYRIKAINLTGVESPYSPVFESVAFEPTTMYTRRYG